MAIPVEEVARVRAATDIVALIGERTGLKRSGRRFSGLCPFHEEKTPSFSVNAEEGVYYCFGCSASGDAITFVRETQHVDFVDAVRQLADRAGIRITEDASVTAENRKRAPLYSVMASAVEWYHERLVSSPDAGLARDYLRSRGYGSEIVRQFRLGWAPDEWDALARNMAAERKLLSECGLGFVNRAGRMQDFFRSRVVFPIFDPAGRAVALGGRILPNMSADTGRAEPKYKNSQENPIYSKRRVLYGLNWAKAEIVSSGEVIVCEGYTDVIGFFQVGLARAVATCGTALGEEHFRLLRNFAGGRVVLAYDADSAGQAGAGRVYEWERRHEIDVAVAALPPGSDPGDLARTDPDALRASISGAKPFLAFRLARIFDSTDLKSPEGRAKAADAALAAVIEHPNPLVREQYVMEISDRCRAEPPAVRRRMEFLASAAGKSAVSEAAAKAQASSGVTGLDEGLRSGGGRAATPAGQRARSSNGSRPGMEALRLAVHAPERISERLERFLFADDAQARAFDALVSADGVGEAIAEVSDEDPELADLLRRIAVEEPAADADDCVVQLIRGAARRSLNSLQSQARLDSSLVASVAQESAGVARDLELIGTDAAGLEAADRLLAWLHVRELGA